MKKILKYIPNKLQFDSITIELDFYDILYTINSMSIPKTQVSLHELFDQKDQR
jgi:hypothetical protein